MSEDSIASEVISASLGGAVSASILYPLEVLKTKMQADVQNDDDDDEEEKKKEEEDGVVPISSSSDEDDNNNEQKNATKNKSMTEYANYIYQTEGASVFFRGVETSAFQSSCEKALYFFAYTLLKNAHNGVLHGGVNKPIPTLNNLVLGYLAEWAHLPITLPIDCWTTQIQTSQEDNDTTASGGQKSSNIEKSFQLLLVLLQKGPSTWYKGISAYVVLCLKPAIQYTVYEQLKNMIVTSRKQQHHHGKRQSSSASISAMEAFLLGMIARAVATILTFPWIRAKVIMQSQIKQEAEETSGTVTTTTTNKNNSVALLLLQMYQKGGIASWYQGIGPELTRGVLSSALMLMIKEKINDIVKATIA